jgi:hypothetical protein
MIAETVDCVAVWLANAQYGVNALLPGVPLLGTDPQPANVAAILQERTNGSAARGQLPADQATPVLLVGMHMEADYVVPFDTQVRDALSVQVSIEYAERSAASEAAVRDGLYTMVAVLRSLYRLWKNGTSADRSRGTVNLVHPVSLRQHNPWTPIGDAVVTHACIVGYRVRDTAP